MKGLLFIVALALAAPAAAHDQWSNGDKIPDWVKSSCCGKADAHHLRPDQVHDLGDYYEIDGYHGGDRGRIDHHVALPSQDGEAWIFYAEHDGRQSSVYCLFLNMAF